MIDFFSETDQIFCGSAELSRYDEKIISRNLLFVMFLI